MPRTSRTSRPPTPDRPRSTRAVSARRLTALGAAALVSAAGAVATAGPASAHDQLTGSMPADGSTVTSSPDRIRLTFSEEVQDIGLTVLVKDPAGASVADGDAVVDGRAVVQPIEPLTASGRYVVAYRVVSADGHPVSGRVAFTLDLPSAGPSATATTSPSATGPTASSSASVPEASTSAVAASPAASGVDAGLGTAWPVVGVGILVAVAVAVLALARRRSS